MADTVDSKAEFELEEPKRVNHTPKVIKIICLLLLVLAVALSISLAVVITRHNKAQKAADEVCTSSGCISAAGQVLESMDTTADPCNDFYQFTCGSWLKSNVVPESESSYSRFTELVQQIDIQLKDLLESERLAEDPEAVNVAKSLYSACLDEEKIEEIGYQPLYDLLNDLGGWPMISPAWNDSNFDLMTLLTDLTKKGYQDLVSVSAAIDDRINTNRILAFYTLWLGLPSRNFYLDANYSAKVDAYRKYMSGVARFLNGTSVEQDVEDVLQFETFIANISLPLTKSRDPDVTYNKMLFADLYSNMSSKFDWLTYVNTRYSLVSYMFTNDSEIIVIQPEFYRKLMERVQTTPARTLANHLLWRVARSKIGLLPQEIKDIKLEFDKVVSGVQAAKPKWKECVSYTRASMDMAVGRLFVEEHFNEQAKTQALEMISGVREAFDELLESVSWMNDPTREVAKEKSAAIYEHVGYADWIMSDSALDEKYQGLLGKISPSRHFGNSLVLTNYSMMMDLELINKPIVKNVFTTPPTVVDAYYNPVANQMLYPAGILQPPFWQQDRPESMNYGAIGSIIGHEITHGFDDTGRRYDKDGNLVEWWDEEVIEAFNEAKQCIIDQYGSYVVPELNKTVNGELTQGENIADNGGLKQSYKAYQKWYKTHQTGQRLPGLEYSPNQLFFIAYGQMLCSLYTKDALNIVLETDTHTPLTLRPRGALSNFPEFSEVFDCPTGSQMNPQKKCSVW